MIVILARASARYQGRIDAELSLGDLCIIIRDYERSGDGSVLVHDMSGGIPPRNWMPAGSQMQEVPEGLIFTHDKRGELLEIYIDTIYSRQEYDPELTTQLTKLGAEQEFSDLISRNLSLLGEGLTLVAREWRTSAGPVDLLLKDAKGLPLCVEVKRRRIDPNAVWQMKRYLDAIRKMPEWKGKPAKGLVVAPVLAVGAKELLKRDSKISFIRLAYQDLKP